MLDLQKPYSQMTTDELAELQKSIAKYIAYKAREEAGGKEPESIFDQWDETGGQVDCDTDVKQALQAERDRIVAQAKSFVVSILNHPTFRVEFVVNREKRTVVALLRRYFTYRVHARGIAKCHPDDCFNEHIGKYIALLRACGNTVADEYLYTPQPTEVRVDVVVEYYGNIGIVDERSVKAYNNAEGVKIIDDSDSTPPEGDDV
ncbi:hypothetical protein [Virgibacillus pantothenticus]|uniref:hypothetical protein n=1 Tax=Virgibacillus pantothenticus TaxID=1473 RepID=UPI0009846943|nr:hypothetical protein [Virgibacillus pantothenticus]